MLKLWVIRKVGWGSVAGIIAVTLVSLGANQDRPVEAAPVSPACAGDLRHLSWVWYFPVDGPKEAVADKLVSSRMGIILKTHDGTDWMSTYDHSPDAVSGPAKVGQLADYFESRGVPFFNYAVVQGVDPLREAEMAAQTITSGSRGIYLDLEPWSGYWKGTPQSALIFGQELRRLVPDATVITAVEPRPWVLPNVPVAEFASFSDAFAPMAYWESYKSNGPLYASCGISAAARRRHPGICSRRGRRSARPLQPADPAHRTGRLGYRPHGLASSTTPLNSGCRLSPTGGMA